MDLARVQDYLRTHRLDGSPVAKGIGLRREINCLVHEDQIDVTTLPLQSEIVPLLK